MIKINGNDYPTQVNEMTLEQWVNVSDAIRTFEKEPVMQLEAVLKSLGVPQNEIDNIELSFTKELYAAMDGRSDGLELVETIDKYSINLNLPLTVKVSKMIDKLHEVGNQTIALLAFFYRDENLTDVEHFDKAHIKHKANQFKKMPASNFVVAVGAIMEYLTCEAKKMQDESK